MERAPATLSSRLPASLSAGWHAALELGYARLPGRTIPVRRRHVGPLRVQKHFVDATGVCQHIIVHPPGGIAGGDRLSIDVSLEEGADVLITSPGAAKWYDGFGRSASQSVTLALADGARLEWLPQETILYAGADVRLDSRIKLHGDASLLLGDVVCLGRPACGEHFDRGQWQQLAEIERNGRLIWCEHAVLPGASPLLASPVGLAGHSVVATLVWAGPALPDELHQAALEVDTPGRAAATQLPEVWLARFIGDSAEDAHHWLRHLRALLHPFTHGRPAQSPRIWAT
ncbi:urease accessory protein UreD [Pseudogulbenkiania ferrooxidans]|uniref:Urease accessory protein UreD n=1 Tax=Pseudogulbenkiania ferrooxidans 2002 TaxID=279714 RepID=B9Z463_9NEIS|nr:urease accessory protein UreD [Pseudogulbenkiania ferrooxidans]EEG08640.1 Urease accessory protein UreD [Pseudogulbenkiania ferrooxidans 2002]